MNTQVFFFLYSVGWEMVRVKNDTLKDEVFLNSNVHYYG